MKKVNRAHKHKILVWWEILVKENERLYREYGFKNKPSWRQVKRQRIKE